MTQTIRKTFAFGAHQVTLETGEIARQAQEAGASTWLLRFTRRG